MGKINKLAKRYLPRSVRIPIRYFRLRTALRVQAIRDRFSRGRFDILPLPPPLLRYRVQGAVAKIPAYLNTGLNCAQNVRSALGRVDRRMEDLEQVLSFGCGAGRVLRWFRELPETCRLSGTDVDAQAIGWCRRHLPFGEFRVNDRLPPLSYEDQRFDLILCLSVLSHLDRPEQEKWMAELSRVARPGALVLFSFCGATAQSLLKAHERDRVRSEGFFFQARIKGRFKPDGLPDFYQLAFQTREDAMALCSPHFKVRDLLEGGLCNFEDLLILQKTSH